MKHVFAVWTSFCSSVFLFPTAGIFSSDIMIRLSPTTIILGESDLRDSAKRESQRRVGAQLDLIERLSVDAHNEQKSNLRSEKQRQPPQVESKAKLRDHPPSHQLRIAGNVGYPERKVSISALPEDLECSVSPESPLRFSEGSSASGSASEEHDYISASQRSPENESYAPTAPSPDKDDNFYYGGFMESPGQSYNPTRSSLGEFQLSRLNDN
jgi:hypothetical protein